MKKTKRTEITIETHDLTIIRMRGRESNFQYCRSCGANVNFLAPAQAAFIFRVEEKFIEQLFESNEIHEASQTALCGNSLLKYFK